MPKTRILVIDHSEMIREMHQLWLQEDNFDVILASDGNEGLHMYYSEKPDIVLTNLIMPGMDGFQVIEQIRSTETGGTRTPIIILAPHNQNVMREYAAELGGDLYLLIPIAQKKLIKHVRAVDARRLAGHDEEEDGV